MAKRVSEWALKHANRFMGCRELLCRCDECTNVAEAFYAVAEEVAQAAILEVFPYAKEEYCAEFVKRVLDKLGRTNEKTA